MDEQLKKALALIEKRGYITKLSKPTTKKTFEVQDEHLADFWTIIKRRDLRIKDAIAEMFELWIDKWRSK